MLWGVRIYSTSHCSGFWLEDEKISYAVNWVVFLLNVGLSWKSKKCCIFLSIIPLILILRIPNFNTDLQFFCFWELSMSIVWQGWQHTRFTFSFYFSSVWAAGSFLPWNESQSSFSCALAGDKMATKSLGNGLEIRTQINETGQKCVTCSSEFSYGFSFSAAVKWLCVLPGVEINMLVVRTYISRGFHSVIPCVFCSWGGAGDWLRLGAPDWKVIGRDSDKC